MKNILAFFGMCLISALSFAQSLIQKADSLSDAKDFQGAIGLYKQILKSDPNQQNALRGMGYAYLEMDSVKMGKSYYGRALELDPQCVRCYFHLARASYYEDDYTGALFLLDKGIATHESHPNTGNKPEDLYWLKCKILAVKGDFRTAEFAIDKAVELSGNSAYFLAERALFKYSVGKITSAFVDINSAIKLQPGVARFHAILAALYEASDDPNMALVHYNLAVSMDLNNEKYYADRGRLLAREGELYEAVKDFEKALTFKPNDPYLHYEAATVKWKLENIEEAAIHYIIAKSLVYSQKIADTPFIQYLELMVKNVGDSSQPSYYIQRGIAAFNQELFNEAMLWYEKGKSKFNNNAAFDHFIGNVHIQNRRYELAAKSYVLFLNGFDQCKNSFDIFDKVNALPTGHTAKLFFINSYYSLSEAFFMQNMFKEGFENLEKGKKIIVDSTGRWQNQFKLLEAFGHLIRGNYSATIALCDEVTKTDVSNAELFALRALARIYLNNPSFKPQSVHFIQLSAYTQPAFMDLPLNKAIPAQEREYLLAFSDIQLALDLGAMTAKNTYLASYLKWALNETQGNHCKEITSLKNAGYQPPEFLQAGCQ